MVEGKEENINVTYQIKTNQLSPKTKTAIQICSSCSFANHQNDTLFTKIGQGNLSINKDSNFIMFFFIICCFLLVLSLNEASSQLVGWSQIMCFFYNFFYFIILFYFVLFCFSCHFWNHWNLFGVYQNGKSRQKWLCPPLKYIPLKPLQQTETS